MDLEWDPKKAAANLHKHGIDFADAATVLHDELAITVVDHDAGEGRFITMGADALAEESHPPHLRSTGHGDRTNSLRGTTMKRNYEFKHGKRGAVIPAEGGKTRITIRIDDTILRWFREEVHETGGGSYQTAINDALRNFIESQDRQM